MKAILLSGAMILVSLLGSTLTFRLSKSRRRAQQMLILYPCCLIVLVLVWAAVPPDCGFLPTTTMIEPPWFDLLMCLFFFGAAFFGGVLQLYNLADRGFSLRILIDCLETPCGGLGVNRLMKCYGGGSGIAWMYRKRIAGLIENRLAISRDGEIRLTAAGALLADRFILVRRFLRMGPVAK